LINFKTVFPGRGSFTNFTITGNAEVLGGTWYHSTNSGGAVEVERICITVGGDFTLGAAAVINLDARGYAAGQGPGAGNQVASSSSRSASYGGKGANNPAGSVTYGSAIYPENLGSGAYSNGGRAIKLKVGGVATIFLATPSSRRLIVDQANKGTKSANYTFIPAELPPESEAHPAFASELDDVTLVVTNGGFVCLTSDLWIGDIGWLKGELALNAFTLYCKADEPENFPSNYGAGSVTENGDLFIFDNGDKLNLPGRIVWGDRPVEWRVATVSEPEEAGVIAINDLYSEGSFLHGSVVGITVEATPGFDFIRWEGMVPKSDEELNPLGVPLLTDNVALRALFRDSEMESVTNRWLSTASSDDWFDARNWSQVEVPRAGQVVVIESGAVITVSNIRLVASVTNGAAAHINCKSLTVAEGGVIEANSSGFIGRRGNTGGSVFGPGASAGGGGGHGGAGGRYSDKVGGGAMHDNDLRPYNCGSGGGSQDNGNRVGTCGGNGGGRIWISVAEEAVVDGTVDATGGRNKGNYGSGGGGGAIHLECRRLKGAGLLRAKGGYGTGGGGGGRIAVWYGQPYEEGETKPERLGISEAVPESGFCITADVAGGGGSYQAGGVGSIRFVKVSALPGTLLMLR